MRDAFMPVRRLRGIRRGLTVGVVATTIGAGAVATAVPALADTTYPVSATIAASYPIGVAVDASTGTAYVANAGEGTVSVIDESTATVVDTITIGDGNGTPWAVAVDPNTHVVFVSDQDTNTVYAIDGTTHAIVATISSGGAGPRSLVINPLLHLVYVANYTSKSITAIDETTYRLARSLSIRPYIPNGLAVDPSAHRLYAADPTSGSVLIISEDSNTTIGSFPIPQTDPDGQLIQARQLALDPATHTLWVSTSTVPSQGPTAEDMEYAIDTTTSNIVAAIALPPGSRPSSVALDLGTHTAYVANFSGGSVSVIDTSTNTLTAVVGGIGGHPIGIAVDPQTHTAFATNNDGGTISVITPLHSQSIQFGSTPPTNPTAGGSYQISATGGASGNPVSFTVDPSSTTGACVVDDHGDSTGTVSFTHAGSCVIDANQAGAVGYAAAPQQQQSLTIVPGPLDHLVLSPATATVSTDGAQSYTATGYDQQGDNLGDVTASTTFTIAPNGSCAASSCSATAPGSHTVTGTDGAATGTAALTVTTGVLDHLQLTPSSVTVGGGSAQSYTATGYDRHGNSLGDVTASTTFTISPDGSCTASSCTAVLSGPHTVTATDGAVSATATLTVLPTSVTSLAPSSGPIGTTVTISGTSFIAPTTVTFGGVSARTVTVVSPTTITAVVPSGAGSGPVVVSGHNGSAQASTPYTVTLGLTLSKTSGPPTTKTSVALGGFAANEAVDIYFDTTAVGIASTTARGTATINVTVPASAAAGTHAITAVGRRSGLSVRAQFLVRASWAQYGNDAAHTGSNAYENQLSPTTVTRLVPSWTTQAHGSRPEGSPVVNGGHVYMGFADGFVQSLSETTGAVQWTASTGGVQTAPAVAGGVVYVTSNDGYLYALSANNGHLLWRTVVGGDLTSSPVVSGGRVYVGSPNGYVDAFDAGTGALAWSSNIGSAVLASPTVAGGAVYVGALNHIVYALNAASGSRLWTYATSGSVVASAVVASSRVYVGSSDGSMYSLRTTNGQLVWSRATGAAIDGGAALVNGILYFGNDSGTAYAVRASTGGVVWTAAVSSGRLRGSATVANGVVYLGDATETDAIAATDGTIVGAVDSSANSGDAVPVNGALLVVDYNDGTLTRFVLGRGPSLAPHRTALAEFRR